jgi:subtilase family serine protease
MGDAVRNSKAFAVASAVAGVIAAGAVSPSLSLAAPGSGAVRIQGSKSPAAATTPSVGSVAPGTAINFEVALKLGNSQAAQAFARAVSTPGSASYGTYLTPAQWEGRFSPTVGQVAEVAAFLSQSGFTVHGASADRMEVSASGTASQIEHVFDTSLAYHKVQGVKLRLAASDLSIPAGLAGIVAGVTGVSQELARPDDTTDGPPGTPAPPSFAPPAGFRAAPPCGAYYNQKLDTELPPYGNGYPSPAPWAVCGYAPPQFRSAYNLTGEAAGKGVTVAITDAFAAPTLKADAQKYASINDPSHPLLNSQFSEILPSQFTDGDLCGGNGWYGEQTLDVEAVHATAPGAHILYLGAQNCEGTLYDAIRTVVDHRLASVITNSWGDTGGDVLDDAGTKATVDNLLIMAAGEGISVMFSSGDGGDEFTSLGEAYADYPASSPWATAVGGTTLQIGSNGQRTGEFGWSTARSFLCNETEIAAGSCEPSQQGTWLPIDLSLDGGSGGQTSFVYPQPFYQAGVVPSSLSTRHASSLGPVPMRVEPDISLDADPATGMLVGETQTFPNGVYYDQYRIGGTSVSSPLLAGIIARADETAGRSLGFLNPVLYGLYGNASALNDILPAGKQDQSRADFANSVDTSQGFVFSTRIIDYEGPEQFCLSADSCKTRDVSITTAPGFDSMTGLGSPGAGFVQAVAGK